MADNVAADVGHIALIHVPSFRGHVPLGVEFVIPGAVEVLQIVIGVFAAIDAIGAAVEVVVVAGGGVIEAGDQGGGTIDCPGSDVVTRGHAELYHPLLVELERAVDAGVGKWIDGVEQRVGHVVVVRRKLGFDSRNGKETARANVKAVLNREVEVDVLQHGIESVAAVEQEQLLGEVALGGGEAVIVSKEAVR